MKGIIKKIDYKGKSDKPEITIDYDSTLVTYSLKEIGRASCRERV